MYGHANKTTRPEMKMLRRKERSRAEAVEEKEGEQVGEAELGDAASTKQQEPATDEALAEQQGQATEEVAESGDDARTTP